MYNSSFDTSTLVVPSQRTGKLVLLDFGPTQIIHLVGILKGRGDRNNVAFGSLYKSDFHKDKHSKEPMLVLSLRHYCYKQHNFNFESPIN